ncbi:MAG: anti-sigma factor antagonist [Myxococcales bacterium]|nr:anti-sigma factor antagonist [Myxococcales bacterium]
MMNERLLATVQQTGDEANVRLAGILDEDNKLGELVRKVSGARAVIDLSGVERINSCGTRDWVNWLARLAENGVQPVFVACSPAIVAQLNLVKNFAGHGAVKSFQVPYHCPECDEEKLLLVDVADLGPAPHVAPDCRCDDCESLMTFDDLAEAYFGFVPNAQAALARMSGAVPELARGSNTKVKPRTKSRSSHRSTPAIRRTAPSLSAFQTPSSGHASSPAIPTSAERPSQRAIRAAPATTSPMLIGLIAMLVCAVGVLAFLLVT